MHELAQIVQTIAAPLLWLTHLVSPALALAGHRSPADSDFTIAAFTISTALIGMICSYWAAWAHARFSNLRLEVRREKAAVDAALRLRDTLIAYGKQSIVVLGADLKNPIGYGRGSALLEASLASRSAPALAAALDALLKDGTAFAMSAPLASGAQIKIVASQIADRAVIVLDDCEDQQVDFRTTLEALAVPIWVRGQDLSLRWANPAFLTAVGAGSLQQAVASNAAIGRFERDLAMAARDGKEIVQAKRYATLAGERRALTMNLSRQSDAGVACFALDVTDQARAEAQLQIEADATADMLDRVSLAIAVFDPEQRLTSYNSAFARLWHLTEAWLDTSPVIGDILDRLREMRRLPEQRDFAAWKREFVELFEDGGHRSECHWHLPEGLSVHIKAEPHLQGGLFFSFEDVSEIFQLKASLTMVSGVQQAMLNTIEDSVAIFAPDGKLMLHNDLFAKLWQMTEAELTNEPHFTRLAGYATARIGRDGVWDIVSAAVMSADPERYNQWGKVTRADGKTIALTLSRLPNGATMIAFRDVTDIERFQAVLGELVHTAA